jgi:hypothetical protein
MIRPVFIKLSSLLIVLASSACDETVSKNFRTAASDCSDKLDPSCAARDNTTVFKLIGNPASVTIENSSATVTVIASESIMDGLSMTIPEVSFRGALKITAEQQSPESESTLLMLADSVRRILGLNESEHESRLTLDGDQTITKPIQVTLPESLTSHLSPEQLNLMQVQVEAANDAVRLIDRSSFGLDKNGLYMLELNTWASLKVVSSFVDDKLAPSGMFTSTASSVNNLSSIPVVLTFSEDIFGLSADDLIVSNGTASNFVGSGANYSFDIIPDADGVVSVAIANGAAKDKAGNSSVAVSQLDFTSDRTVPTVSLSSVSASPTNVTPIPVTVTFSESVTGLSASDFVVTNGAASNLLGSGSSYTVDITPAGNGVVAVDLPANVVSDVASNSNTAATQLARTYNNFLPSVIVSTSAGAATNASSIPVTVTFSVSVSGFVIGDLDVSNATVSSFAGSGAVYTFTLSPITQGSFTAAIAANRAEDIANNQNTASNTLSVVYDTTAPTLITSSSATAVTGTSPIPVSFTFSEGVTGFTASDITVTNGTKGTLSGSGTTYSIAITPSAQGVVTIDVPGSSAQDAAGNNNSAAAQLTRTYDNIAPTVTIASTASSVTSTSPIPVSFTFSESVTGFTAADITVSNGTKGTLSGSGTSYSIDITPSAQGVVTIDVPANGAQDAAGTNNSAATQLT